MNQAPMNYCTKHKLSHSEIACPECRFQGLYESFGKADEVQIDGTHYKDMAMQPWDVMQSVMTKEEFIGFLKGNIIKYSMRDGKKPGALDDAKKAKHYAQKLAEVTA